MKKLILLLFILYSSLSFAQEKKDSNKLKEIGNHIIPFFKKDSTFNEDDLWKEALDFFPYEGRIIRNIYTEQLSFEIDIEDFDYKIVHWGTRLLDRIHIKSKPSTIERNLYIAEGDSLKAYLLADNERFLRTISYIQDARIKILPIENNNDSIDILVVTKDIFGYSGLLDGISLNRQKLGVSTINLNGTGQKIGIDFLNDKERNPHVGWEGTYGLQNIKGSFVDAKLSISTIQGNLYNDKEDEINFLLDLNLPLVSQYKRWAGGLKIGREDSKNLYPDTYGTGIYQYKLGIFDSWIGYNLGVKNHLNEHGLKVKKLISLRYFNKTFFQVPAQIGEEKYDQRFNSNQGILAGLTLFKQYYYKTNYIYGFGTTEDIPAGYNGSLILGWYEQLYINRPYLGINFYNYSLSASGDMSGLFFRLGSFYGDNQVEDIGIVAGASMFLRLMEIKNTKIRNYFRLSYATIRKRTLMEPLRINNSFGLYGFGSDLAKGDQRISLRSESFIFIQKKILGFNIAPITIVDIAWLNNYATPFNEAGFFLSVGTGLRIKNENLGLSTIEIRASFLPRKLVGDDYFSFTFSTNLNFNYRGNYITKPEIIEINSDANKHIF